MKYFLFFCSALLLLALVDLPIGYYTFLRIIVTIGAVLVAFLEFQNGVNLWVIIFSIIAVIFNPLIPIYLSSKDSWMLIDISASLLFIIKAFTIKTNE